MEQETKHHNHSSVLGIAVAFLAMGITGIVGVGIGILIAQAW